MTKFIITAILCFSFSTIISQIDIIADKNFSFTKDGSDIALPYYSTHDLMEHDNEVTKLVIVQHGTLRNADDYFDNMKSALSTRPGMQNNVLIVAPQFITEEDVDAFDLSKEFPYWSSDGWKVGSNSRDEANNPRSTRIPSYEVLDSLILHIVNTFSTIESFVLTGHSAGGQLTNRYTASSPIFQILCDQYSISSKSIIANPGSYVYLSPTRRVGISLDQFEIPTGCEEYNDYSYGLRDLYTYHSRAGADQMKLWYSSREVVYLFGAEDNDPNATTLPRSCRASLQGDHRLERGIIYFNHIRNVFGEDILNLHNMHILDGVGHSNFDVYHSVEGLNALFDGAPLMSCNTTTATTGSTIVQSRIFPNPSSDLLHISAQLREQAFYVIYNNQGRETTSGRLSQTDATIDISNLKNGVYFLTFKSDRSWNTQQFIKL